MGKRPFRLLGLAILSLSGILLEIALTRVFSVLYFYNYVFIILSVAVLGMGLGAAVVHQWTNGRFRLPQAIPSFALAAGASVTALAWLIVWTVGIDGRLFLGILTAVPFLFIGMVVAGLFTVNAEDSPVLYWADLFGAGLGAALAIPVLNWFGGVDGLLAAAILFTIASGLLFLAENSVRKSIGYGMVWVVVMAVTLLGMGRLSLDMSRLATPKPITRQLQNPDAHIISSTWDAFARVDVVETAVSDEKLLFMDGAAGSIMPQDAATQARYMQEIGYFPFRQNPERVFIIGPGGGKDVLFGLMSGSEMITAAEVSEGIVETVRQYGAFNGELYNDPHVTILVDEGRSALQRQSTTFDLIYLSEIVALTAEMNSFMLTENYVFTVEAFHDYLNHLAPGGQVALKLYDELTLTRAFVTAVTALKEQGLSEADAVRQIVVLLDPKLVSSRDPLRSPLLIIYGDPISPEMGQTILTDIENAGLIPLFVPHVLEQPPLGNLTAGQLTLDDLVANFERGNVSAPRDTLPFFYEFRIGLPETIIDLAWVLSGVMAVTLLYLVWRRPRIRGRYWSWLAYFALLGAGFMMVELTLIQKMNLFLGHPTRALTVSLFVLLTGSGLGSLLGSWLAKRWPVRVVITTAALFVAAWSLTAVWLLPLLLSALFGLPVTARIGVAAVILLPCALALGMPFPLGLQQIGKQGDTRLTPLAWGVNGLMAVLGSTAVIGLAITWGFNLVIIVAALIYVGVAVITQKL